MPRKQDRFTYLKEVILEFTSGRRTARISDISAGGCYIDTIVSVIVGDAVTIHISATDGSSMPFNGQVAYILAGNGFGVEFLDLTSEHEEFLKSLMASVAS
jgi:hypothetical protein